MRLQKEILQKFDKSKSDEVMALLDEINPTRLQSSKREIQSALITLSQGSLYSLKVYLRLIYKKEEDVLSAAKIISKETLKQNDIKIGENEYIKWIDLGCNYDSENIDDKLVNIKNLWDNLATECIFECCGISACNFERKNILKAVEKLNENDLLEKWKKFKKEIQSINNEVIGSIYLNQNINKSVFLKLLEHIEKNITTHNIGCK